MSKQTRRYAQRTRSQKAWLLPVTAGILLLAAVAVLVWRNNTQPASAGTAGTPSLKADKEMVDLGDVRLGETVSVAFKLTNTGTAPLRFSEAPYVEVVEGC